MKTITLFSFLCVFLCLSCNDNPANPGTGADEQEIYRLVMDTVILKSIDKQIVLADYSNDYYLKNNITLTSDAVLKQLKDELKVDIDSNLCKDYTSKNIQRVKFSASQFNFKIPLVLLSDNDLSTISSGANNIDWTKFYLKYSGAQGYSSLSRIGFNTPTDLALVYVDVLHETNVGAGYYILLKKVSGVWKIYKYISL